MHVSGRWWRGRCGAVSGWGRTMLPDAVAVYMCALLRRSRACVGQQQQQVRRDGTWRNAHLDSWAGLVAEVMRDVLGRAGDGWSIGTWLSIAEARSCSCSCSCSVCAGAGGGTRGRSVTWERRCAEGRARACKPQAARPRIASHSTVPWPSPSPSPSHRRW
jgi:hypothetical protein